MPLNVLNNFNMSNVIRFSDFVPGKKWMEVFKIKKLYVNENSFCQMSDDGLE